MSHTARSSGHRLDSLGGKSTLVTMVTTVTMSSGAETLVRRCTCSTRSSTQPTDSRASASWSQHSSMVSQSMLRPCGGRHRYTDNRVENAQYGSLLDHFQRNPTDESHVTSNQLSCHPEYNQSIKNDV